MADDDRRVLASLEPDQIVADRRPLGRKPVTLRTQVLLGFLRVYITVAVALVVYAFWRAVHR